MGGASRSWAGLIGHGRCFSFMGGASRRSSRGLALKVCVDASGPSPCLGLLQGPSEASSSSFRLVSGYFSTQPLLRLRLTHTRLLSPIHLLHPLPLPPLLLSLRSAAVLLGGLHRAGLLQRHRVPDGLRRRLPEVDGVPRLRHAVPGQGPGRAQLLQEPGPGVQPLVLLQARLRRHWLGLLRLPPG